eukprot:TRINITY_DN109384_c0_g1_i1.p1 TRINITY_DN109384_c0_g1~~TRINITY_DN109384_c0_g1_i1.p1  ORF type:complete len:114 (+),score=25.04 TRINITY_DN109384_c0_g1_i1:84-425(+)
MGRLQRSSDSIRLGTGSAINRLRAAVLNLRQATKKTKVEKFDSPFEVDAKPCKESDSTYPRRKHERVHQFLDEIRELDVQPVRVGASKTQEKVVTEKSPDCSEESDVEPELSC